MGKKNSISVSHFWALACALLVTLVASAQQVNFAQTAQTTNSKSTSAGVTSTAQTGRSATVSTKDKNFIMEAGIGGMEEVELGRLATQKGSSDAGKQFGQKMVDDHSAANAELTELAKSKSLNVPAELDAKHKADVAKFSKLSGAAFDKAYSKAMLDDHNKDVAAFEQQSVSGTDPDLKAFAAKTLPTLKTHLEMAKALNAKPVTAIKPKSPNR